MAARPRLLALCLLTVAVLITACASGGDNPDRTPLPTSTIAPTRLAVEGPGGVVQTALPAAPEYRLASTVITTDNVPRAELVGRLDPPGQPSSIFTYAFNPNGTQLAALDINQMMLWDLINGERLFTGPRQEMSYYFFSPQKTEIFGVDLSGRIRAYETNNAEVITTFDGLNDFNGAHAYDSFNGVLAMGSTTGLVNIWDLTTRNALASFNAHSEAINVMVFSPDASLLATAGNDSRVRIWDWRARRQIAEINLGGILLSALAFDPDNARLAVATAEDISLWTVVDVPEADFEFTLTTGSGGATDVLAFSPDGRFLVNGGVIDAMLLWDAESGQRIAALGGVGGDRVSAAFSPDSTMLITAVLDGPVQLWNLDSINRETGAIASGTLDVPSSRIIDVAWSPDGYQMLFFDATGSVFVWGIPPES